jgi:4-amino-4-deoxy-L-arabinose transferase-like glycosyltransferase
VTTRPTVLIAILCAGLALYSAAVISHYGVTIDSPSLYYAGDRTLFWLEHRDVPRVLALDNVDKEPRGFVSSFGRHPELLDPIHYPVLTGLLGALSNRLFHEKLGWLDVIDGHQLPLVFLHALAVFLFGLYCTRLLGPVAGVAATIALVLFPSALGHSFNNAKDWPCAQFYGLAVLAAGVGIVEARAKHLLAAGVFIGLALSCKLNAVFVPPTIILWTPIAWWLLYRHRRDVPAAVVGAYLVGPYLTFLVFFALWPWLYYGHVPDWWRHLHWYVSYMLDYGVRPRPGWTAHPFKCLLYMTPPVVLVSALVYAAAGWRRGRERAAVWSLLLIWLLLPIVRIAAPNSNFYDANRHFIEYIPALCAVAGAGVALIVEWLRGRWPAMRPWWLAVAAILAIASLVAPIVQYHPYETTYFNFMAGGLGKAQRGALFRYDTLTARLSGTEGDYWYNGLRRGLREIETAAGGPATVASCGPRGMHFRANMAQGTKLTFLDSTSDSDVSDFVFASPRPNECDWIDVRELERVRPVLKRVERDGGLIYELLGRKDGQAHPVVTGRTAYDKPDTP